MDAVKFIEERKRMCEAHAGCPGCPAFRGVDSCIFSVNTSASSSEQVELVEDWSIAHPRKTRQSVFLEQWTQARLDDNGCLYIYARLMFLLITGMNLVVVRLLMYYAPIAAASSGRRR